MKSYRLIIILLTFFFLVTFSSCGGGEQKRIKGIKENINIEYHADLNLSTPPDPFHGSEEYEGRRLYVTEIFDIVRRPSEGSRIVGVRIGDKNIKHEIIGAEEYEYIEEPDGIKILLGEEQELLEKQAGRFRLRLTRSVSFNASGFFRHRVTFEPARVWALVEDESKPDGYTPVELDEPDLGSILLHTKYILGDKQPAGGRRAPDRRSVTYSIPTDMTKLKPLTFTFYIYRSTFYLGKAVTWVLNRLAWMLLGIVIYLWWRGNREKAAKEKESRRMVRKKEPEPAPRPALPPGKQGG